MNITKKIVATIVGFSMVAMMAPLSSGEAAISAECRADLTKCTTAELSEYIAELNATLSQLQAQLTALQTGAPAAGVPAACTGITFTRNLKQGMSGNDVKCLQAILNQSADTQVAVSGAGSPGSETTYFGPKTKAAVSKYQLKNVAGTVGTGYVGPKTRAKLNSLLAVAPPEEVPPEEVPPKEVVPTEPTASLAPDTPVAATVPLKAAKVPVLKVILQAASEDLTVSSMTFKRTGVGSASDWSALYLYVDDLRVTTYGKPISADTQLVEFPALNISIPAASSKTVTLRADVASDATAGNQSAFQLTSIAVNVTFTGLPITSNTMTIGGVGVSTTTVAAGVTLSDPIVGAEQAPIGSFKITAGDQDVELKQVILTITGTIARANVTNIKLYYENELLAETAGVDKYDNAILTLAEPYAIPKTLSRTFTVKADLAGRAGETLTTKIQESGDVLVIDKVYGYGAVVSGTPVSSTEITLKGGTLSLADQGPLTGKIAKNAQDVVLTKIGLTANRDVEVIKLKVKLRSDATTTDITDLRIKDANTGATLMQKDAPTNGFLAKETSSAQTLSGPFNLTANQTRNILITVDVGKDAKTGTKIAADLEMESYDTDYVYVRDIVTGDYVKSTEVIPASVTGDDQEIVATSLDLNLASSPISATVITGAKDVSAVGLMFSAGGGSDVTIKSIQAKVHVNSTSTFTAKGTVATRDKITLVKLYDGASLLSQKTLEEKGTVGEDAYGLATFDNLNITVAKNTTKVLVVKLDTAPNLTVTYYAAVSVAKADVDARDPDNNQVSLGGSDVNSFDYGTAPDRVITIETKGTLSLAKNVAGTPIEANIAVGKATDGKAGVALLAIDLTAKKEDVKVTKIVVERTGTADDRAYKSLALDGIATALFAAGATTAEFKNLEIIVPAEGKKTLTIKADLAGIDGSAVKSDQSVKIKVATTTIEAIGVSSGKSISCGGSVAEGDGQYLYQTTVKVALSADTPKGTAVPGTEQDVLHLDFINEGKYDATLKNATFTIAYNKGTSDVTTTTEKVFKLYDGAGNLIATTTSTGMATAINGATITFSGLTKTLVPGTTKLILKGDTTYVVTGKSVYQSFNVNAVSDIVWHDGYVDVSARHFVAPLVGGTLTY